MTALVDRPGLFRCGGVGIFRGEELVHMAPPADRVPQLMSVLFDWLKRTEEHPLVARRLFHYESMTCRFSPVDFTPISSPLQTPFIRAF